MEFVNGELHFSPRGEFSPNDDGLAADVLRRFLAAGSPDFSLL
jgi:hypothetical protein